LTDKQRSFIEHYCSNGFNATQAAISAGYSEKTAQEQSSRLLSNVIISDAIQLFMGKATKKALVTTSDIVERLWAEANMFEGGGSQSGRIAALKTLTDFTGGFDANKQKHDLTSSDGSMSPQGKNLEDFYKSNAKD
jgi:phage terminase small subunit